MNQISVRLDWVLASVTMQQSREAARVLSNRHDPCRCSNCLLSFGKKVMQAFLSAIYFAKCTCRISEIFLSLKLRWKVSPSRATTTTTGLSLFRGYLIIKPTLDRTEADDPPLCTSFVGHLGCTTLCSLPEMMHRRPLKVRETSSALAEKVRCGGSKCQQKVSVCMLWQLTTIVLL